MKCNHLYSVNTPQRVSPAIRKEKSEPSFGGNFPHALTHVNIGSCADGYIGKISARLEDGREAILNVFKRRYMDAKEQYTVFNDYNERIGQMVLVVKKYDPALLYDKTQPNPSHVFVDELRNFSKPGTPYYTEGLTPHKDIGTRLLQIAQRRSDETCCNGNVKLISKDESKQWYMDYIGLRQEFPVQTTSTFGPSKKPFRIQNYYANNPNQLYLPPERKEPLSKLRGGL